jgi:hypothetical protein
MGLYNTVVFNCPRCDARITTQSKADDGYTDFSADSVPVKTAMDILGEIVWCSGCDRDYKIVKLDTPETVHLGLTRG